MVTVRQYCTNRVGVIIRLRVDRRFVLPNSYNMGRVYQTEQVVELPLIVHVKWLLLKTSIVICLEIMLITCILGLQLRN